MLTGWRRCRRARVTIAAGMVAENSMVWRSSGVLARIRSTSGRKPRSSISSASSSTSTLMWLRSSDAAVGQVEQPPGRADHDLDAAGQARPAGCRSRPRRTRSAPGRGAASTAVVRSALTWLASSRVGRDHQRLRCAGLGRAGRSRARRARRSAAAAVMPKARVLPVPVRAWPIMSVPVRAIGMAMDWIGNGVVMPTCVQGLDDGGQDAEVAEGLAAAAGGRPRSAVRR